MEAKGNLYTRDFIYAIIIFQVENDRALGPLALKVIVPRRERERYCSFLAARQVAPNSQHYLHAFGSRVDTIGRCLTRQVLIEPIAMGISHSANAVLVTGQYSDVRGL